MTFAANDEPSHHHLAAEQADERDGQQHRDRQRQPRGSATPDADGCDTQPGSDRRADPDEGHAHDDREEDHRRALPPGQMRRADEVAGLVLPGRPRQSTGDTGDEGHRDGRGPPVAPPLRLAGGPTGGAAGGSLGCCADRVADGQADAARHALDDPATGDEGRCQRGEPEDEASSEADGANGASNRCHAHSAIPLIAPQRTPCDPDGGPRPTAFRPRRWCYGGSG